MVEFKPLSRYFPPESASNAAWAYFRSTDRDEVNAVVSRMICNHSLVLPRGVSALDYSHRLIEGNSVKILQYRYGGNISVQTKEVSPVLIVTMPLAGCISYRCGAESGLASRTKGFVPNVKGVFSFDWDTRCEALTVCVDRAAVKLRLARILDRPLRHDIEFGLAVETESSAGRQWLLAVRDFIEFVQLSGASSNWLLPQYEELLLTAFLYSQPHNYSRELMAPQFGTPRQVKMLEAYLEAHVQHKIAAQDLVKLTGLSENLITQTFKKYRGCTPFQYVRLLRLKNAHQDLVSEDTKGSVTDVASKWGFFHFGRFSEFYKKHYNESPSQTLRSRRLSRQVDIR